MMTVKMGQKLSTIAAIATTGLLLTGLMPKSVQAYQFFRDRASWEAAIEDLPIQQEDFNQVPDGSVEPVTTFPSGLKLVESGFLGSAEVSDGALEVGLAFPSSVEEFAFPTSVKGFGFDFSVLGGSFFVDNNFDETLVGNEGEQGFFGVVAEPEDSLIEGFKTITTGELGLAEIDNVSFASEEDDNVTVPEPSNLAFLSLLVILGLFNLKKVKLKTSE
ncbi:MAG: hypothetical protein SAQ54_15675 [Oscillatoria sp. PMC 1050.18]|nr:hypothetical protein [Oscillatoria sp. PMC 1050.18]